MKKRCSATYYDCFSEYLHFMTQEGKALVSLGLTEKERNYFSVYHAPDISFSDEDIVEVIAKYGETTPDSKIPLLQIGQRGCTGATPAMLATDLTGRKVLPVRCNLGNDESIIKRLQNFGVKHCISDVNTLEELQERISEVGSSSIVSVESIGGHSIIVDSVKDDRVEIRDPYHGWAVAVTKESFLKSWGHPPHRIIQGVYEVPKDTSASLGEKVLP